MLSKYIYLYIYIWKIVRKIDFKIFCSKITLEAVKKLQPSPITVASLGEQRDANREANRNNEILIKEEFDFCDRNRDLAFAADG